MCLGIIMGPENVSQDHKLMPERLLKRIEDKILSLIKYKHDTYVKIILPKFIINLLCLHKSVSVLRNHRHIRCPV